MNTVFHWSCWPKGFICLTSDCWTAFPSRGLAPAAHSFGLRTLASVAALWLSAGCRAVVQWSAYKTLQGVVQDAVRRIFLWGVVLMYLWSAVLEVRHYLKLTPFKLTSHLSAGTSCQKGRTVTVNNILIKVTIKNLKKSIGDSPVDFSVVIYCLRTICLYSLH